MNQNQVIQAMGAENRRLREHIVQMQKDAGQRKFMEDLLCAALTGLLANPTLQGQLGKEIADLAVDQAEAVLQVIVSRLAEAQGGPEAEGEVATP